MQFPAEIKQTEGINDPNCVPNMVIRNRGDPYWKVAPVDNQHLAPSHGATFTDRAQSQSSVPKMGDWQKQGKSPLKAIHKPILFIKNSDFQDISTSDT